MNWLTNLYLFALLPIITRYLSTYTSWNNKYIIFRISFIFAYFCWLKGHSAININFFKLNRDNLGSYIKCFIYITFYNFFILIIVIIFSSFIENKSTLTLDWQIMAVITAFGQFITLINLSLWIAEQKPFQFGIYQSLQTILITLISIILIIGYSFN